MGSFALPCSLLLFEYSDDESDQRNEHGKEAGQDRIDLETAGVRTAFAFVAKRLADETPLTVIERHISRRRSK